MTETDKTIGEIGILVNGMLDRIAIPKGRVYIGEDYSTANLRDDLEKIRSLILPKEK